MMADCDTDISTAPDSRDTHDTRDAAGAPDTPHLLLTAEAVSLHGIVGQILPPTSLEVARGGLTIVTGGDQLAKTALGLTLSGRMLGFKGQLRLANGLTYRTLRLTSALVDAPDLSEPDAWMTLQRFVTGELKIAKRPANTRAVQDFLSKLDACEQRNVTLDNLPVSLLYTVMLSLLKQRRGVSDRRLVKTFCIVSPDRRDTNLTDWWLPIRDLLLTDPTCTVILICQEATYTHLDRLYSGILSKSGIGKFRIGNQARAGEEA